jgi:hypothetical protein
LASNIQITGPPEVAVEDVYVLIKENLHCQFITVKAVVKISQFIHISDFITRNCITENIF